MGVTGSARLHTASETHYGPGYFFLPPFFLAFFFAAMFASPPFPLWVELRQRTRWTWKGELARAIAINRTQEESMAASLPVADMTGGTIWWWLRAPVWTSSSGVTNAAAYREISPSSVAQRAQ